MIAKASKLKEKVCVKIEPFDIQSIEQQKLLRVFNDKKLTFYKHINNLCIKPARNGIHYVGCHPS